MPYAAGVYTLPPGTAATTLTPIDSSDFNTFIADIEAAQNAPRPIVAGGTGAVTAAAARIALGLEIGADVQAYSADISALVTAWTAASASGPASLDFHEDTDNGTNKVTLIAPASVASDKTLTMPDATDTLVGKATTDTLTNKRVAPRTLAVTSAAEPTINTDNCDIASIAALATAITSMTTNLTGTATTNDVLIFRIKDNGTARAIAWGASFKAEGVPLPTTTVISKQLTVAFMWNGSTWGCVGWAQEA